MRNVALVLHFCIPAFLHSCIDALCVMEPILIKHVREPNSFTLDFYVRHEGYAALKKALTQTPDSIVELVKASGLRGRGGAGFPTGMKWQFVDKKIEPRYIACNADESEPGTFKDHLLMERNPHLLIEGCAIGCYAIGAKVAYIYIRGEFFHVQRVLEAAIEEAYKAGFLGKNILGSGFDCDVYVHRGAGAYEAGEETALLESLEGKRAQPRNKPPFPAVVGLYGKPTAVNNVETLCNVPLIVARGAEWYAALGPEKNGGPKLYCVSGHVRRPGVYEASMNITLRELIDGHAGGVREGRTLKAVIPGGSSVPILMPDQLDTQASFDAIQKAGSLLGSAAIVVLDDTTCMMPDDERQVRKVALVVSALVFVETLLLWFRFAPGSADFQFVERYEWIPAFGIHYAVGVDGISLLLLVLTGFLTPLSLVASWESVHKKTKAFCISILLLESAMLGVFVSLDLFLFYVFWDAMLIPMYFLIGIWGYDRRIYAAIKFLLYTMAGSVLMLLAILGLAYLHSTAAGGYSFDLLDLYALKVPPHLQFWFFLAFALAFAIKVPLFPFHT